APGAAARTRATYSRSDPPDQSARSARRARPLKRTVLLAKPMNGINAPQRPDCVADDAVSCERTSLHTKFPANREINREFRRIRPSTAIFASNQRANSKACSQIPYAMEQGNFAAITGNFFGITGKFNPG